MNQDERADQVIRADVFPEQLLARNYDQVVIDEEPCVRQNRSKVAREKRPNRPHPHTTQF